MIAIVTIPGWPHAQACLDVANLDCIIITHCCLCSYQYHGNNNGYGMFTVQLLAPATYITNYTTLKLKCYYIMYSSYLLEPMQAGFHRRGNFPSP